MLEQLRLKNFRCFEDYRIEFDKFNVVVGRNNTGKSTIIDALRLVSNARRYAAYRPDLELEKRDIPFSLANLRYNYEDVETVVYSRFSDDTETRIVFPTESPPFICLYQGGSGVADQHSIWKYFGHSVGIIPPVGVFEETEELGYRKYIRSVMVSHLTSRHFRNIWLEFPDGFEEFQGMVEQTWPGYTIQRPSFSISENNIEMYFKEDGIAREIFWAGHGFQVWLQLLTFLVKLGQRETLVLDEPDIYLHSDLQKKLVSLCKARSNQVIIATHAVDIIEEVEPDDIISVDKDSTESCRLSSMDEVQTCITQLGSYQNLRLAHFVRGKTCLFVEGEDFRYLKILARNLGFDSFASEDGFSVIPLGGVSNWERLRHIEWIFANAFGERVKCYVLLDRDYNTNEKVKEISNALEKKGVSVHIWERKEIENYAFDTDALYRMFKEKFSRKHSGAQIPLSLKQFKRRITFILNKLRLEAQSQMIATRIKFPTDHSIDESTVASQVLSEFQSNWKHESYRKRIIPGKEFFARMNGWLNSKHQIAISVGYAFGSLKVDEIDPEITAILTDFVNLVNS